MGLGGLFDDSPDSEAESEPGSPDLMSAAWVERTARDLISRGFQQTAREHGWDIASELARLDLAERSELDTNLRSTPTREELEVRADALRAEHAVALAQNAEANRRLAAALELHAIVHAAISGAGGG